ncbi:hypothetical protein V1L54_08055 [Streptomyces sp. TRM 70361]|uniref:hypothetical protein n=1 Tax=Streptomyces sp. TRM 70361 TaxID=3116553 RepID=UPI002E7AE4BA|nr:hypothetical protein [Streptomyces sp. TRM 70361]MEE1939366.1 hypothetical protein [Streptomyces sp. TRM 70361]
MTLADQRLVVVGYWNARNPGNQIRPSCGTRRETEPDPGERQQRTEEGPPYAPCR